MTSLSETSTSTATTFFLQPSALPASGGVRKRAYDSTLDLIYLDRVTGLQFLDASTAGSLNLRPQAFVLSGQNLVTSSLSLRLIVNTELQIYGAAGIPLSDLFQWEFHPDVRSAEIAFVASAPEYSNLANVSFYVEPNCTITDGQLLACALYELGSDVSQMQLLPNSQSMFIGAPGLGRQAQEVHIVPTQDVGTAGNITSTETSRGSGDTTSSSTATISSISSVTTPSIPLPTPEAPGAFWLYAPSYAGGYYVKLANYSGYQVLVLSETQQAAQQFVLHDTQNSSLLTASSNLTLMVQGYLGNDGPGWQMLFSPSTQAANAAAFNPSRSNYIESVCSVSSDGQLICSAAVQSQAPVSTSVVYDDSSDGYVVYLGPGGSPNTQTLDLYIVYVPEPANSSAVTTTPFSPSSDASATETTLQTMTITTITSTEYIALYVTFDQTLSGGTVIPTSSPAGTETNTLTRTYTITTVTSTDTDVAYTTGTSTLSGGTIIITSSPTATAFRTTTQTLYLTPVTFTTTIFYYTTALGSDGTYYVRPTSDDVQTVVQTLTVTPEASSVATTATSTAGLVSTISSTVTTIPLSSSSDADAAPTTTG
ncbi:uncharacterized protein AB675_8469 [Cyphellophora attinorum]|uniref:Uncharacterized protein n=1 Tax=Cyphellophora attinorum TaxID=1664694 RepID=A0A0N1HGD4_9EURO|nr:uncharacterized protein AB675_8469 [Phialophora attinorum]KPI44604.1 hypothetical protein AB675_8469 [Phialophora attinorum]